MGNLRVALIGVGGRGEGLYRVALRQRKNIDYVAICDVNEKHRVALADKMEKEGRPRPALYEDYKRCIDKETLDAVVIATSWQYHLEISMYAMEKGVAVGVEVGGAYSIQSLWELVRCYERTKTPIMMLENCCYGRLELLALNMKRLGKLGEIVHMEGAYRHDLRAGLVGDVAPENNYPDTYRQMEYIRRNTENYPTHEIGPIAKILDINCGNRFLSLTAMASDSRGLEAYIQEKKIEAMKDVRFNQADVVTTLVKCANGESVTITLDTTLPRYYSRGFLAQGTKGLICEENKSVFLEEDNTEECWDWSSNFNNVHKYYEKYEHPIWQGYTPGKEGHGGMDMLVFDAFFHAVEHKLPMPVDVYDIATWMSISVLVEESLLTGQTVAFPDFTDGKWLRNKNEFAL